MGRVNSEWSLVAKKIGDKLSAEQKHIVELLAMGKTQAEVGAALGQHRSMIWRKVQYIRLLFPRETPLS